MKAELKHSHVQFAASEFTLAREQAMLCEGM